MKKIIAWIMLFIQTLCVFSLPAYADADNTSGSAEEILEIIVKYKPGRSPDAAYFADDENNISNGSENTESEPLLVQLSSEEEAKSVLAELQQDENIEYAEPNYKLYADAVLTDPLFDKQWGLENVGQTVEGVEGTAGADIRAKEALRETYFDNGGVTVAVIDGGIDLNHPDLKDNIFVNTGEIAGDKRDNDGNGCDDDVNGWDFVEVTNQPANDDENDVHGTHVAGIIAAALNGEGVQGVAPHAKILPLKIMKNSVGTVYNAIQAIDYAERMGAQIANCSWSLPNYSAALEYAMEHSNMLFVCSAGNNGNNLAQEERYPASFGLPNVISVAFTDNRGELHEMSNYGKNVDIAAPGVSIYSTVPVIAGSEENGVAERKYAYLSGSSMAAPFVAGAAALIKGHENNLSAIDVKKKIVNSATKMNALSGKVSCGGMLNAAAALKQPTFSGDARHTAYYGAAAETVGNSIYRIGGYNSKCTSSVSRYDASNKSWGYAASMKGARANHSSVVVSDKIYVFGGENNGKTLSTAEVYDVQADTWTSLSVMPKGIKGAAISAVGNKIYLFGGVSDKKFVSTVYMYDTESDSWTAKGSLPQECAFVSAVALDNQSVYLFGGVNNSGCLKSVLCYNVSSGTFSEKADMAEFKHSAFALKMQDKIYVIGGNNDVPKNGEDRVINGSGAAASVLTAAYEYDPAQDTWSPLVDLNVLSFGGAPVYHNNDVYYIGGLYGSDFASVEHYRGFDVPQNIRAIMQDDKIELSWNEVSGATHYYVEKDGVVLDRQTTVNVKFDYVSGTVHSFRVRAEKDGKKFAWSKVVTNNEKEQMEDALVTDGGNYFRTFRDDTDVHWYKIKINEPRSLSLRIENIPSGNKYQAALCDFSGNVLTYGREEDGKIIIDKFSLEPYTYYVKVFQLSCENADRSYKLNLQLDPEVSSLLPQRIFADLLKPANATVESSSMKLCQLENYPDADFSFGKEEKSEEAISLPVNDNNDYDQKFPYIKEILSERKKSRAAEIAQQSGIESDSLAGDKPDDGKKMNVFEYDSFTRRYTNSSEEHEISLPVSSFIRFLQDDHTLKGKIVISLKSLSGTDSFSCGPSRDSMFQTEEYLITDTSASDYGPLVRSTTILIEGKEKSTKPYFGLKVFCQGTYEIKVSMLYTDRNYEDYKRLNDCFSSAGSIDLEYCYADKKITTYGYCQPGALDHAMDVDYYKVELEKGDKLSAYVETPNTVSTAYAVSVFNRNEEEISCSWKTEESKNMSTEIIIPESGTYYVSVFPSKIHTAANQLDAYDENFSCWYRYNLYLFRSKSDEHEQFEINDRFDMANEQEYKNKYIGSHEKVAGAIADCTIDSMGDKDIYPVELNAGDKLSVQLTDKSNNEGNFRISIIENLYKDIGDNAPGILRFDRSTYDNPFSEEYSKVKYVTFIAPATKTYYVQVHSYKNVKYASVTGKYDLGIAITPGNKMDRFESRENAVYSNDFRGNLSKLKNDEGENPAYAFIDTSVLLTENKYTGLTLDNQFDVDWYRIETPKNGATAEKQAIVTPSGASLRDISLVVQDAWGNIVNDYNGGAWMALPGATYYIGVTRYESFGSALPATIEYTLEICDSGNSISSLVYNNGSSPKKGTNTLTFNLNSLDVNATAKYTYEIKMKWSSDGETHVKYISEPFTPQQENMTQSVNLDINQCGDGLKTMVYLYLGGNLVYTIERDDFVTNNKIEFEPVGGGTFIYDNSPEYLTEDDFADYNLGDKTLYTAENVEGIIDIQSSHSVPKYVLDKGNVYFDFMLYNPTDKAVTVNVLRFGAQLPLECAEYGVNATSSAWVCLQAWADYLQMNIDKSEKGSGTAILKIYNNFEDKSNQKYESYTHKNAIEQLSNNGHYVIQPGQAVWVMGSSRLCMKKQAWSPVNMVARLSASGPVNISILAFRDINNVYSPKKPELVYREDQRNYPSNVSDTEKEDDLNQKYKGTVNSLAEVEAHSTWIIDDNTNYYSPYVFNMANPEGYNISQWKTSKNVFWLTNYNVNGDEYNNDCGTESEMLPLEFADSSRTWYFNTRRFIPAAGNGMLTGTPPVENATIMGNYGVIQRYYIDIKNDSSSTKKIIYALGTESHAFVRYKLKSETDWKSVVKCYIPNDMYNSQHELFSVDMPELGQDTLIIEVILPNGDRGGFRNYLYVRK